MALKEAYMQYREELTAAKDIELKPDEDESFLIKSVQCSASGVDYHCVELKTGRTTVGYIMTEANYINHIPYDLKNELGNNLIEELRVKGINVNYPVATGESFTVRDLKSGQNVIIVYEIYDAGDRKKGEVNGSEAREYYQLNYGYIPVDAITPKEYNLLSASFLPKEMVRFPFGEPVPAKIEVDLIGLFGIPSRFAYDGSNMIDTKSIKLIRERTTLFTKQSDCFAFEPKVKTADAVNYGYENSQIGFGYDTHKEDVFYPPTPITFTGGEELGIYLKLSDKVSKTNSAEKEKKVRVGVIERIRKV